MLIFLILFDFAQSFSKLLQVELQILLLASAALHQCQLREPLRSGEVDRLGNIKPEIIPMMIRAVKSNNKLSLLLNNLGYP